MKEIDVEPYTGISLVRLCDSLMCHTFLFCALRVFSLCDPSRLVCERYLSACHCIFVWVASRSLMIVTVTAIEIACVFSHFDWFLHKRVF